MVTTERSSLQEARQVIANFPFQGSVPMLMEAVNEVVAKVSGLDIKIPRPQKKEISVVEDAASKGISNLSLLFYPRYNTSKGYPSGFLHRLSSSALENLDRGTLGVKQGWRIADTANIQLDSLSDKQKVWIYEGDQNFLGPIIKNSRIEGDIADPNDLGIGWVPIESRQALLPMEITTVITPKVDSLLKLPKGTMRLPTLREAMMASELYNLVPLESSEWQRAKFLGERSNRNLTTGIELSHNAQYSDRHYYRPRARSKHFHHTDVGFRLIGMLN